MSAFVCGDICAGAGTGAGAGATVGTVDEDSDTERVAFGVRSRQRDVQYGSTTTSRAEVRPEDFL